MISSVDSFLSTESRLDIERMLDKLRHPVESPLSPVRLVAGHTRENQGKNRDERPNVGRLKHRKSILFLINYIA